MKMKKCKACKYARHESVMTSSGVCESCAAKALVKKSNSKGICLHCKKPLSRKDTGAYHADCRFKRNRKADKYSERYA